VIAVPRILPAWACQVSMYLDEVDASAAAAIPLPWEYMIAPPDRQRAFRAGRHCAQLALDQLGWKRTVPGLRDGGGPDWPVGVTGSITHSMALVCAAAALKYHCNGIGIDIEPITSLEKAHQLASRAAASPEVFAVMDAAHLDYATAVAVIIAAKHSLYKCLQPLTGRSFGYLDASIDDVQAQSGRFHARLKTTLSQRWPAGTTVGGQLEVSGDFIYTSVYC